MIGEATPLSEVQVREIVLRELRNSDLATLIRQLQGSGLAGKQVRFGRAGGMGMGGFTSAGPFAVPHGLGEVPAVVLLTAEDTNAKVTAMLGTTDATNFNVYLRDTTLVANSGTYIVDWLAVA